MDFNKVQPTQQAQPMQTQASRAQGYPSPQHETPKRPSAWKRIGLIVTLVLVVLALVGGAIFFALQGKETEQAATSGIDTEKYQAVFMTNGQVYFGRLDKLEAKYSELTEVYYLQVQQDVQPAAEKPAADRSQVSLTKLGSELHGPTDRMHIASDQILFWENLKEDSTVTKAIKEYEAKRQ